MSNKNGKKDRKSSDITNTQEIDINDYYYTPNKSNGTKTTNKKKSNKKKAKNRHPIKNFFKKLFSLIVAVFLIYSVFVILLINKVDRISLDDRISDSMVMLNDIKVKNVLLIGTDGRSESDSGRSDSMMLLSINGIDRKLTITSFMRDMYVSIPNYGYGKLNSAYSYGGASLLLDTIESNFAIEIDDCIIIDFQSFMSIVDAVGGIDVTISDSELTEINNVLMSEGNKIAGDDKMDGLLTDSGDVHLNGKQALTYSRIRYVGDADFDRTQRQRNVIYAIVDRLKTPNVFRVGNFANTMASEISTNMNPISMYGLSLQAPFMLGYEITQQRIPADDTWYYDDIDGQSVIIVDYSANTKFLSETIY
ncbi:MAG: LCP family protein [Ruminococcus sp.]|nr:LCP family protein [Ruminococcus sp.]MCD7800650.1 LCP family protein [Ruminococcus sp.]